MGRVWAYVLVAAFALSAVAGCGGGSGSGSGDAEGEINAVLQTAFTTSDPVQCEQLTADGIAQLSPSVASTDDPVAECKKNLDPTAEADSIVVEELSVDGAEATAKVTPDGGAFEGATVTLTLVDEDGWKIDGLEEVELQDREAFLAELDERAANSFGNDAFTSEESRCIAADIRRNASDEELEETVVSGERGYLYDAVRSCLGGGTDTIALVTILRNQLVHSGVDPKTADCLAGASIAGHKGATLEEFAADHEIQERIVKATETAAEFCL